MLVIEKYLSYQTPLILSFIDYEQVFVSVGRRSLENVLSLYSILLYMDHFDGFVLRSTGGSKIDQMNSFTYLGSIITKDGGSSEDVESRIAKA